MTVATPKLPPGGVTEVVLRSIHYLGVPLVVRYTASSVTFAVAAANSDLRSIAAVAYATGLTVSDGTSPPQRLAVGGPPIEFELRADSTYVLQAAA